MAAVSVLDTSGRNAGCRHGLLSIHKGRMYLSRSCRYRELLCTLSLLSNVDVYLVEKRMYRRGVTTADS